MNQHDLSVARNRLATGSAKVGHDTGVRGPVNHQATILNQLNSEQISAVRENPDLNRKLRVDRIKRLALYDANYNQQTTGAIDDPSRPDWEKFQSLEEINMIRSTKKELIMESVMSQYLEDSHQVFLSPGDVQFISVPLDNNTQTR